MIAVTYFVKCLFYEVVVVQDGSCYVTMMPHEEVEEAQEYGVYEVVLADQDGTWSTLYLVNGLALKSDLVQVSSLVVMVKLALSLSYVWQHVQQL